MPRVFAPTFDSCEIATNTLKQWLPGDTIYEPLGLILKNLSKSARFWVLTEVYLHLSRRISQKVFEIEGCPLEYNQNIVLWYDFFNKNIWPISLRVNRSKCITSVRSKIFGRKQLAIRIILSKTGRFLVHCGVCMKLLILFIIDMKRGGYQLHVDTKYVAYYAVLMTCMSTILVRPFLTNLTFLPSAFRAQ